MTLTFDDDNSLTLNDAASKKITFSDGANYFADHAIIGKKDASLTTAATEFSAANYSKVVTIDGAAAASAVSLTGNNKKNYITAGTGGATLNGGKGNDTLVGGAGADIFIYENKTGKDVIVNYEENDTISLVDAQIKDASVKSNGDVIFKVGNNKLTVKNASDKTITLSENGTTKIFDDGMIYDGSGSSVVIPAKYKSSDEETFDAVVKTIDASEAKKKLNLVATATDGATMTSGKGNDTLTGGTGSDYISGGKGKDILTGGAGADSLWGGKGNDTLYGGDGNDTFIFRAGDGNDTIADYTAGDMLQILKKNGSDFANVDSAIKSATFKNDALTLNVNGGGKVLVSNVSSDTAVNVNETTQTVSDWIGH